MKIWMTRLIIERITNEYSKRISKVTIRSPPSFGEGRGQRSDAPADGGPTASAGNVCHSLPMDRIAWFDGLRKEKARPLLTEIGARAILWAEGYRICGWPCGIFNQ